MSRNPIITTLLLTLVMAAASLTADAQPKVYEVRGNLVNEEDEAVQFAHVININRSQACISDTEGRFRLLMLQSDTAKISCMGFVTTGFALNNIELDSVGNIIELGVIVLKYKLYELSTVSVYAERWKSFMYDYEQVKIADEPYYVKAIDHWKQNLINVDELKQLDRAATGIGFSFDFQARKRRKAEKKIAEFQRQDELNQAYIEKYNPTVVAEATGLSLEEAQKFIDHFKLDRDFVLERNDYDLYILISQLFKEYNKIKQTN